MHGYWHLLVLLFQTVMSHETKWLQYTKWITVVLHNCTVNKTFHSAFLHLNGRTYISRFIICRDVAIHPQRIFARGKLFSNDFSAFMFQIVCVCFFFTTSNIKMEKLSLPYRPWIIFYMFNFFLINYAVISGR